MRQLTVVLIIVNILIFGLFGLAFALAPQYSAEMMSVQPDAPNGWIDLRATYGGANVGVAVVLFLCLRNPARRADGLFLILVLTIGFMIGRILGLLGETGENYVHYVVFAIEILSILLTTWAWKSERKHLAT